MERPSNCHEPLVLDDMLDDMLDDIGHMSCDDRDWFLSLEYTDRLTSIVAICGHWLWSC